MYALLTDRELSAIIDSSTKGKMEIRLFRRACSNDFGLIHNGTTTNDDNHEMRLGFRCQRTRGLGKKNCDGKRSRKTPFVSKRDLEKEKNSVISIIWFEFFSFTLFFSSFSSSRLSADPRFLSPIIFSFVLLRKGNVLVYTEYTESKSHITHGNVKYSLISIANAIYLIHFIITK